MAGNDTGRKEKTMKHINAKTERGYKRALEKRSSLFAEARAWVAYHTTSNELYRMARELVQQRSLSEKFAEETMFEFLMAKYLAYSNLELADDNVCEWFHDISAHSRWVSPKCWGSLTENEKEIERLFLLICHDAVRDAGPFKIYDADLEDVYTWAQETKEAAQEAVVVAKKALRKIHTSADQLRGLSVAAEGNPENREIFELVLSKLTDAERSAVIDYLWR